MITEAAKVKICFRNDEGNVLVYASKVAVVVSKLRSQVTTIVSAYDDKLSNLRKKNIDDVIFTIKVQLIIKYCHGGGG